MIRASAQTRSPAETTKDVAGTRSSAAISQRTSSRTALAVGGRNAAGASTARSARISWAKANPAFRRITATPATESAGVPPAQARTAARAGRMVRGWVNRESARPAGACRRWSPCACAEWGYAGGQTSWTPALTASDTDAPGRPPHGSPVLPPRLPARSRTLLPYGRIQRHMVLWPEQRPCPGASGRTVAQLFLPRGHACPAPLHGAAPTASGRSTMPTTSQVPPAHRHGTDRRSLITGADEPGHDPVPRTGPPGKRRPVNPGSGTVLRSRPW